MAKKSLNARQQEFILVLAADPKGNQTLAAEKAGFSKKCAKSTGHKLMHLPQFAHVQAAYQDLVDKRLAKYDVTDDRIIQALSIIAFGDRTRIHTTKPEDLFPEERILVDGYKTRSLNDGTSKVRVEVIMPDRERAIDKLCKIRGMYRNRHEVKLDVSIAAARQVEESILGSLAKLAAASDPAFLAGEPPAGEVSGAPAQLGVLGETGTATP